MADEQLQRDQAALRAAIDSISNETLKTHMLAALSSFDSSDSITSSPAPSTAQTESDKSDAVVKELLKKEVKVQEPRDALFVAIHALLLEAGFKLSTSASSEFVLPENWDANSASGLFTADYVHPNDDSIKFSLQGLFVGGKFEVYISDDKNHTHSKELRWVFTHIALLVGGGDAFPPNLGGGNPDMMVGPDHPLFGRRGDPSMGPVPGARFDPFGPSIDPLGPSGFGRVPGRGPAPRMPFGGPGPDHLRMPRDNDDMDPGFGLAPASEQELKTVLRLMLTDRFVSSDVLTAMAQWLVQLSNRSGDLNLLDVKVLEQDDEKQSGSYMELVKQMYVTLGGSGNVRLQLAEMLGKLVATKEHAKGVVRSGILCTLLQAALEQPDEVMDAVLLQNFILVGTRVASFVCYGDVASGLSSESKLPITEKRHEVCELVVALMLSGVSLVFAEAVRLLQLLIDNAACRALLSEVLDLRGALEKAHTLARLRDNKLTHDAYFRDLCDTQYSMLSPEIDDFERKHGGLVGLPMEADAPAGDNAEDSNLEQVLRQATDCKTRGNVFFRRGNFPTARVFYRRAVAMLHTAQLQEETALRTLPVDKLLARCSIGASVQVCSRRGDDWQDAMVSDVEENGASSQVEVLYDVGDQEDEWVSISRIRLRMNTTLLSAFEDLAVDCSMNMGKTFSALGDHDQAEQCFSRALTLRGGTLIAALYARGLSNMARRDLTAAQQDLWNANQQCCAQQKNSASGGKSKTNARDAKQTRDLHRQIVSAYKKLQQMHANKKRLDKKVIKQMVKYLATIPGLQDESN
ncbi:hypothetical protein BBJ29_002569 [Phytophthora kernoviae]|uniref:PI31 proteasome regulator N-terminal domain-containing protein n=1 Tax=Phytophthora kernoviae TaxID=325452 RepID=A0A3F2RS77_9STRA|nr:hypothetical protein BBP00_00004273 [Phytophthora kernoviae]RLN64726.1 hypothetical protein BBJ29_002569 [Phytophthora kernoviae]